MDAFVDFLALFFPKYCLGCGDSLVKGEDTICTTCIADLPRTGYHALRENPIERRLAGRLSIGSGWAFLKFRKEGIVQNMLHQLKYNNHPEVGVLLGKIYGNELRNSGVVTDFDIIIPVPLHESRRRRRGYNQSAAFAEGLGYSLRIAFNEKMLIRKKQTETQTRKSKSERWLNVKDVFAVSPAELKDKKILLVDDVITTGATVEACGKLILESGCQSLSVAFIAEAQ